MELKTEPVNELGMEHTAMVMRDVNADVMGVVESEARIALDKFSAQLLEKVNGVPYQHVMVIDGNDDRGSDVGVMTRAGYEITSICSHLWKPTFASSEGRSLVDSVLHDHASERGLLESDPPSSTPKSRGARRS